MGRSVRVVVIAAAMLISFPAAAFADTGPADRSSPTTADCRAPDSGPVGPPAPDAPTDGGDGGAGSGKPGASGRDRGAGGGTGAGAPGEGDGRATGGQRSAEPGAGGPDTGSAPAAPASEPAGSTPAPSAPATAGPADSASPASEPAASKPAASELPGPELAGSEPTASKPAASEPTASEPTASEPAPSEPTSSEPTSSEPASSEPASSEPTSSEPATSDPAASEPSAACDPGSTSPAPSAPAAPPSSQTRPATPPSTQDPAGRDDTPKPAYPGAETSAAALHGWGEPNKVDDFDDPGLPGWNIYDGPGHAGKGLRSPEAVSVKDGILTINGDSEGKTAGMAWTGASQKYGRWEGRVRAPASDPTYNALLLLWPTAENFPIGGEIDFMEMTDHTRQTTELFLHYGHDNSQVQGEVAIDATQWHNWAVEWSPSGVVAYVDGKEWWRTRDTSILPPGPMHLCIQLDWFPEGGGKVKPSTMEVDWVRQYPLPESEKGDGGRGEGLVGGLLNRLTEGAPDDVPGSRVRGPSGT